jgi:hypothetical protein
VEFNRANAVAPSFRIQFNIGQTCAELQDYACAAKAFESFLADGGTQVPPAQRTTAESELERLRALVVSVRVVVNMPGAEVAVDDVPVGVSPLAEPLLVSAGRRKISVAKPPLAPASTVVDVAGGDSIEVRLDLVEPSAPAAPLPPAATAVAPIGEVAHVPSRTPFWIGVGATGLLTAVTVTFGVLSLSAKSDLDGTIARFGATSGDVDAARSKVSDLTLTTDVFGAVALAAAGITTVLFFTTKPPASRVGVGPGGLTVVHAF